MNIKPVLGRSLFKLCNAFPRGKPWLRSLGLRTSREWFAGTAARVQFPDGRTLVLRSVAENYLSFELFWRGGGYYEPISRMLAEELVGNADLFVDAGANAGFYTLVLAGRNPRMEVVAFEPNPKMHRLLRWNVAANNLANVCCEPLALSDRRGRAQFFLDASDMSASLEPGFSKTHADVVDVQTESLDHYLEGKPEGRMVIKVDVEGHEPAFFDGARTAIAARRPDILAEVTSTYDESAVALLKTNDYKFYPITDRFQGDVPVPVPVVRGELAFLNYLLSPRPRREIAALFEKIAPQVGRLDLNETSKRADRAVVERLRSAAPAATDKRSVPAGYPVARTGARFST